MPPKSQGSLQALPSYTSASDSLIVEVDGPNEGETSSIHPAQQQNQHKSGNKHM